MVETHNYMDYLLHYIQFGGILFNSKSDENYHSVYANAIAESSFPINEEGLLAGLQFKLNNHWEISTYFDQFKFPWMRYQVDKPNSFGMDGFLQLVYHPNKKLTFMEE